MLKQSKVEQNVVLTNLKKKEEMLRQSEFLATKYAKTMDNRKQIEEEKTKKAEEMKEKEKQAEERYEIKKKEEEEILQFKKEERLIKDMEREMANERKKRAQIFEQEKNIDSHKFLLLDE